jgi:L-alanine-DL-glutamate epimerase-like enolase superfamily enzyme
MTIVDLQTTVVGTPWRELTFLELETDSGLVGLGEVRMVNKTDTLLACIRELAPPVCRRHRSLRHRAAGLEQALLHRR